MNCSTATTDNQPHSVKVYPGLARVAMAAGWSRDCRWWHILRDVASRRDGWQWFTVDQVIAIFDQYGLSRRQAYDLFAAGNGVFFEVNRARGVVALVGLQRVCEALGCAAGRPVALPINQVSGRLTSWRSAVYALGFAVKARNISRSRLQANFGIGRSTQRRYEAQTGVRVESQFAYALPGHETQIPDGAPWWYANVDCTLDELYQRRASGVATPLQLGKGQTTVVVWQMSNRYVLHRDTRAVTPTPCRRGMSRKTRLSPAYGDGVPGQSVWDKKPRRGNVVVGCAVLNPAAGLFDYVRANGKTCGGRLFEYVSLAV